MNADTNDNLQFSIDASPNFKIYSEILEGDIPMIVITGRMMGDVVLLSTGDLFDKFAHLEKKLLIDLRECLFFSSTAFSFLYELALQRREKGRDFIVIGVNQQIHKVICMMGMEEYFVFVDTVEEALAR